MIDLLQLYPLSTLCSDRQKPWMMMCDCCISRSKELKFSLTGVRRSS